MRSILPGILLLLLIAAFTGYHENIAFSSLIQWHNMLLVWGGTFAVVVVGFGFKKSLRMFKLGFLNKSVDATSQLVEEWALYAEFAQKQGIIKLDSLVEECDSVVGKLGLKLLSDNRYTVDELEKSLNSVVDREYQRRVEIADIWGSAAEKGPYAGIVGTVLSMFNLWSGSDISQLGAGIAIAFTATLYGLGLSLVAAPLANRVGRYADYEKTQNLLIVAAIKAIRQDKSKLYVRNLLQGA